MKKSEADKQVEAFFSSYANDDPMYLKKYVNAHPDNKMAWYLLGRDYMAQGKQGKAMYCFAQAGEVYEAFEEIPIHINLDRETEEKRDKRSKRRRMVVAFRSLCAAAAALLLLLAYGASPDDPKRMPDKNAAEAEATIRTDGDGAKSANADGQESAAAKDGMSGLSGDKATDGTDMQGDGGVAVWYTTELDEPDRINRLLQQLVLPASDKTKSDGTVAEQSPSGREAVVVQGIKTGDGKWIHWTKQPEPLFTAHRTDAGGQLTVRYHSAAVCNCKPEDAGQAAALMPEWQSQQEQLLVVRSAISAYKQQHGSLPKSAANLVQNYPNNMLPGLTPRMNDELMRQVKVSGAEADPSGQQPGGDEGNPSGMSDASSGSSKPQYPIAESLTEPLQIIVDKKAHRLALVSGKIIIRNYPVGLGAERTPEGEFAISEKVRNPNGKSNGDFGSRGMTLSDTLYAIHGTNEPDSIGKDESLGCVRMLKEDIEELFDMTPLGTKVTITSGEADALPEEIVRSNKRFSVPVTAKETNPKKVYRWLD